MSSSLVNLRGELLDKVDGLGEPQQLGLVRQVKGVIVRALMQEARVGDICVLKNPNGSEVLAEVVGSRPTPHLTASQRLHAFCRSENR
jgi:flagellar biosynthesis/type III secretory pathway ATPase